jgi:hypothetical protein
VFELPEINRRNLIIVGGSTLIIALTAVILTLVIVRTSTSPTPAAPPTPPTPRGDASPSAPPFGQSGQSSSSSTEPSTSRPRAGISPNAGFSAPRVEDLLLPPANELIKDWSWRSHVPIGEPWPEDRIELYWSDPRNVAEEVLKEMNDSLIESILGMSQ